MKEEFVVNKENYVPRMRTIEKAYREILNSDPQSCITMRGLRRIIDEQRINSVKIGTKTWLNLDELFAYFSNLCYNKGDESYDLFSSLQEVKK